MAAHGTRLPLAPPVLYGFSPLLLHRQPHWPPAVSVCGFWAVAAEEDTALLRKSSSPPPSSGVTTSGGHEDDGTDWLERLLQRRPLYVGFGSATEMMTRTRGKRQSDSEVEEEDAGPTLVEVSRLRLLR